MKPGDARDDVMALLAGLPVADLDAGRSREILDRASRTMHRRTRMHSQAENYVRMLEPAFATALSFAQISLTAAQSVFVLQHYGIGIWR